MSEESALKKIQTFIKTRGQAFEIGGKAKDGWVYAGDSSDGPMFVSPWDARGINWHEATKGAENLQKRGKKNARLPMVGDLRRIFNNRAIIEAARIDPFNTDGSVTGHSRYLSSESASSIGLSECASTLNFADGSLDKDFKVSRSPSVLYIRS